MEQDDPVYHRAQALQRLIEGASPFTDWARVLAPHADLLASREPLLAWAPTRGRSAIRSSALLWLVTLEHTTEPLLRHVLSLLEAAAPAGAAPTLEQPHGMHFNAGFSQFISPLSWVLYCRCHHLKFWTPLIRLERLELLLRLGCDPNAPVVWHAPHRGHSPLYAVLTTEIDMDMGALLLSFGARFNPLADVGGLSMAMLKQPMVPLLQLLRAYPDALQGAQHNHAIYQHSPLNILATWRSTVLPGAVDDARFLHETLGVSLLSPGTSAADLAAQRPGQTPEWLELSAYLDRAQKAEALEAQRRMSVAVHHALQGRLGPELTAHIGNHELLPRDTFARFGRKPPPPPPI